MTTDNPSRAVSRRRRGLRGYSVPLATGIRGAGLGNECLSWAKAAIAADVLDLELVEPQWGLNRRGYSSDFGSSRVDWMKVRAMRALPTIDVDDQLLDSTGHRFDYRLAMEALRDQLPLGSRFVLRHRGMAGGFASVSSARPFLRSKLLGRTDSPFEPLPNCPRVTFHVRADDFHASDHGPRPGQWNTRIPVDWYRRVAQLIRAAHPDVTMEVLTDERTGEIADLARDIGAQPQDFPHTVLGDLDRMATTDLLVCSVSTFSLLAAFLSDRPYIWFEPNLYDDNGWRSIWGSSVDGIETPTVANVRGANSTLGRGYALAGTEVALPPALSTYLQQTARFLDRRNDLLHHGVIRHSLGPSLCDE